uniref:Biogenesis of lysosomal organelles complex 1 subunit 4 n=1 Tax=Anolis carolinensis TaxID=28377 RepID=A0A803TVE0_ANOCA
LPGCMAVSWFYSFINFICYPPLLTAQGKVQQSQNIHRYPLFACACRHLCFFFHFFFLQIETLDKGLEDLLTRVDEFVGMLDMIRSDSSQVVNENVPHIHAKAVEMRQLYRKIDKLEAFVKMVGNSVSGMEEQITKAESDLGTFPNTFKKLLHTINVPSFLNKSSSSRQNSASYEPSDLFKTEDYFPCLGEAQNK